MPIGPIKAEVTQLIVNSVSSLRKSYKHIGKFHSPMKSVRWMMELTEKVILVAFIIIPLAVIAYIFKSLIGRVILRPGSSRDSSQVLPGPETPLGPRVPSKIQEDANRLGREFDHLLNNLKDLHSELGRTFEANLTKFLSDNKSYEKNADLQSIFNTIEGYRKTIQQLKAMGRGLYVIPSRLQDNDISPQPSDGNCLFHSLVAGLEYLNIPFGHINMNKNELAYHLRTEMVNWMRGNVNDETLQGLIDQAIGDFIEMKSGQMKIERATAEACLQEPENAEKGKKDLEEIAKIEEEIQEFQRLLGDSNREIRYSRYFDKVGQQGFFGSKAEIYAFCQRYPKVRVDVRHQLKDRFLEGYDFSYNEGQLNTITLVYVNGDHFNLQIPKARPQ